MIERTDEEMPSEETAPTEETANTAEIPLSLIGDQAVKPGDVIRLKVVSVNDETGAIIVSYAHPAPAPKNSRELAEDITA